jgi:hypothetical protein
MVMIQGGCYNCGEYVELHFETSNPPDPNVKLICNDCYKNYYSPEAIRERKLNKLFKKSLFKRLLSIIR